MQNFYIDRLWFEIPAITGTGGKFDANQGFPFWGFIKCVKIDELIWNLQVYILHDGKLSVPVLGGHVEVTAIRP